MAFRLQTEPGRLPSTARSAGAWLLLRSVLIAIGASAQTGIASADAPTAAAQQLAAADIPASDHPIAWVRKLRRGVNAKGVARDPFSSRTWIAPAKPVEPPPPAAPRFPFTFVGLVTETNSPAQLFLSRADRLYKVTSGDLLDKVYRVDRITKSVLEVTYLPLGKKQSVEYADITRKPEATYAQAWGTSSPPRRDTTSANASSPAPDSAYTQAPSSAGSAGVSSAAGTAQEPQAFGVGIGPVADSNSAAGSATGASGSPQTGGGSMRMLAPISRLQTRPPLTQLPTQPPLTHLDTQPPPSGTLPTLPPPGSAMPIAPAPAAR